MKRIINRLGCDEITRVKREMIGGDEVEDQPENGKGLS